MRSRLTTGFLVVGLVVFAAGGVYTASAHLGLGHHGKKHDSKKHKRHSARRHHHSTTVAPTTKGGNDEGTNSAANQYGTRPGKGCGDRNHVHTGPPGNPSNTSCPPQSRHSGATTPTTQSKATTRRHHGRHHSKRHSKRRGHRHS